MLKGWRGSQGSSSTSILTTTMSTSREPIRTPQALSLTWRWTCNHFKTNSIFSILPTDAQKITIEFYDAYNSQSFDSIDNKSDKDDSTMDNDKIQHTKLG